MTPQINSQNIHSVPEAERIEAALNHPDVAQAMTLHGILRNAAASGIGRKYGFTTITRIRQFAERVPVGGVHTHRSMIELQRATGAPILTGGDIVDHLPGRSLGKPVNFPVSAADRDRRAFLAGISLDRILGQTGTRAGRLIDLSNLADPQKTGPFSGRSDRVRSCDDISGIADAEVRIYLTLLLLVSEADVSGLIAPSADVFLHLEEVLDRDAHMLLADLEARTVRVHDRMPRELATAVRDCLSVDAAHLQNLVDLHRRTGRLGLADLLPSLRGVVLYEDAAGGEAVSALLPDGAEIIDAGCWRPEGVLSFAAGEPGYGGIPALLDIYFEFECGRAPEPVGLHELREGEDYRVMVTTASGLYRCRLDLSARVTGWAGKCPRLQFWAAGEASVAGRRRPPVESGAALKAVQAVMRELEAPRPFVRFTHHRDGGCRVIVNAATLESIDRDTLARAIDRRLGEISLRYRRHRDLGRIGPVEIAASPATCGPCTPQPAADATGGLLRVRSSRRMA